MRKFSQSGALKTRLTLFVSSKTEESVPSLSYLGFLRRPEQRRKLAVSSESNWFELDNQRWVLEGRLATLVKAHMEATNAGKDTSFTVHKLTMAHCDFVYWRGFWDVVDRAGNAEFVEELKALAQVVSSVFFPTPPSSPLALGRHCLPALTEAP